MHILSISKNLLPSVYCHALISNFFVLIHRIPECIEVLKQLNSFALESSDSHGRALYMCCCFDHILQAGEVILSQKLE